MIYNETAWLAGLLEAEGSFYLYGSTKGYTYPAVQLTMTDEDVVARAGRLLGWSYKPLALTQGRVLVPYELRAQGVPALAVARAVYGWMSNRRQVKIAELIGHTNCSLGKGGRPSSQPTPRLETLGSWTSSSRAEQVAWLAGVLEGDGCFHSSSSPPRPAIRVDMTDEDTVERVASFLGVSVRRKNGSHPTAKKRRFVSECSGWPAVDLMRELRPLMGRRRSQKIDELIEAFEARGIERRIRKAA